MYGLGGATKTDELSEKFQTAFEPPSLIFFFKFHAQNPYLKVQNLQYRFLNCK